MKSLPLFCLLALAAFPALAQEDPDRAATEERIDRLERDIMVLQRQLAREGVPPAASIGATDAGAPGSMDEQLRKLQGSIEQNQFQIKKLSDNFEKFQRDTDMRFSDLTKQQAAAATAETPAARELAKEAAKEPIKEPVKKLPELPAKETPAPASSAAAAETPETTAGNGVLAVPENSDSFATPRDLYNYAFRLLNETKYPEAAKAFEQFVAKYPKDPLIGNAYYWRGETYYIQHDYVTAADSFRQGFESMPTGPKAPDNLLKLAMSLDLLHRDDEACVVLKQIVAKFKKSSTLISNKADLEIKRLNCK